MPQQKNQMMSYCPHSVPIDTHPMPKCLNQNKKICWNSGSRRISKPCSFSCHRCLRMGIGTQNP